MIEASGDLLEDDVLTIIYDDKADSVSQHVEVLNRLGASHVVTGNMTKLKTLLLSRAHVLLCVDQHMPDVYDLGEVGLPQVKTDKGENVGIAIIRGLLPAIGRHDIQSYVLSGFELSSIAGKQIERARLQGMHVEFLSKPDTEKFEAKVRGTLATIREDRNRREFLAAERILLEWANDDSHLVAQAFSWPSKSAGTWEERRKQILLDMNLDARERVALILSTKESLAKLFGVDNLQQEMQWLKEKDVHLPKGDSPWNCIFSGRQRELAAVAGLLFKLVG